MTKFWTLVRLGFSQQFRVKPSSSGKGKGKKIGTIALYGAMALVFVPIAVGMFVGCLNAGIFAGQANMTSEQMSAVVGSLLVAVQGVTLLFGFAAVISNIFNCRDADKLLHLPVSTSTIFMSKFFVAYVNELVASLLFTAITLLPFGIGAGFGVTYFAVLALASVLVPLLPMLLATLFSMPISLLLSKLGKNGVWHTVFNIVLYLALMAVYLFAVQSMSNAGDKYGEDVNKLFFAVVERMGTVVRYIHPDYMLASALVAMSFGACVADFGVALAEFCALALLLLAASRLFYGKLLASSVEGGTASARKRTNTQVKQKSGIVRNLAISDFKRVVRDPQMGFQCFVGMIGVPAVVILLGFAFNAEGDDGSSISLQQIVSKYGIYVGVGITAYLSLLTAGTNVLGLYPISRENKSLYLLKTLPVPFGKILFAKVLLATLAMFVTDVITAVAVVLLWGLDPVVALLLTAGLFAFGFGNMCYTTKGDLKNPKLGWSNFQTSLKNSKNSWFAMLLGLISAVAVVAVSAGFFVWYAASGAKYIEYLMWVAVDIVGSLYALFGYRSMNSSAEKLFADIEP